MTADRGLLDDATWRLCQASVPILCVDVVPLRLDARGAIVAIGLIRRPTAIAAEGERWMTIGGRLRRGERIADAIEREVREALGPAARVDVPAVPVPAALAEYMPGTRDDGPFDPRQHAVGLTYAIAVEGEIRVGGEATDFRWFEPDELPTRGNYGFGQWSVVADMLDRFGLAAAASRVRGTR